jgi:hypothetical protein
LKFSKKKQRHQKDIEHLIVGEKLEELMTHISNVIKGDSNEEETKRD